MTKKKTTLKDQTAKTVDKMVEERIVEPTAVEQSFTDESQERAVAGAEDVQRAEANEDEPVAEYDGENPYERHKPAHSLSLLDKLDRDNAHDVWTKPWVAGRTLDAPPAKDGYEQRWVRVSIHSVDDQANLTRQLNAGWMPVKADSVPSSYNLPTMNEGSYAGCIVVGSHLLCEMPAQRTAQRRQVISNEAKKKEASVKQQITQANAEKDGVGYGNIVDSSATEVQFSRGRTPVVAPND
jgi:hypothetical protein